MLHHRDMLVKIMHLEEAAVESATTPIKDREEFRIQDNKCSKPVPSIYDLWSERDSDEERPGQRPGADSTNRDSDEERLQRQGQRPGAASVTASDVNEKTLSAMLDVNMHFCESRRKGPSTTKPSSVSRKLTSSFVTYPDSYSQMFQKYIDIAQAGGYDGHASVWRLLSALFPSQRLDGWSFERGEQIGEWLKAEAQKQAPEERGASRDTSAVWNQLCIGDTDRAFQLAINNGQPKLASILQSSLVCPESAVHCIKAQIDNWRKCEVLHLISKSTLKCYILMSGMSHYEWTHEGQKHSVNCLEGLTWIQALGIHVWYLRQWTGLEEAYASYQKDVVAGRAASNRGDLYGELIKLACESQHSIETVLDCAAGESPHDHFLQWHVWSVLYSVGFRTMSKVVETRLHRSFSAQLETARLPKHAVFVLQHIDDDEERATGVKVLLDRIARLGDNRLFEVISHKLDIPAYWIAEAQFATAKASDDGAQMFELAVSARDLLEIRQLFVDDIAPTAVVAGDNDALRTACNMVRPFEDSIPEWGATGMVYTDYCRLLDYIEADVDDQTRRELLDTIEMRLHAPSEDKPTVQRLALQTIGRHVFEFRRNKGEIDEWSSVIGQRQLYKVFRDRISWGVERYAIEFD
uniref:Nup96 domain-containing protein n=1 Tax=Caenorhabditis tropicalis TaxID=1561998 RepID=A0A1I7TES1_9PELO